MVFSEQHCVISDNANSMFYARRGSCPTKALLIDSDLHPNFTICSFANGIECGALEEWMKFSSQPWMIDVRKLETNLRAIVCTFTLQIEVIQPKNVIIRSTTGIPEERCFCGPCGKKKIFKCRKPPGFLVNKELFFCLKLINSLQSPRVKANAFC